ncbi:MAG: hypothetical protein EPN93_10775 [Spirochaetes bacterium]|nr:MAG: hypothetical protein EPN93_10775 [Spirochaetota bacterium]
MTERFDLQNATLSWDPEKSIVTCREKGEVHRKVWIKKLEDAGFLTSVIEDGARYYLACESGESQGTFLCVDRENGETLWDIPGRSFLQVVYEGFLYMIFVDEQGAYFLLKIDRADGSSVWHHRVDEDLCEYRFSTRRIRLYYSSGREEVLDGATGHPEF